MIMKKTVGNCCENCNIQSEQTSGFSAFLLKFIADIDRYQNQEKTTK